MCDADEFGSLEVYKTICDDDKSGSLEFYRTICDDDKFGSLEAYILCVILIGLEAWMFTYCT